MQKLKQLIFEIMKRKSLLFIGLALLISVSAFSQTKGKLVSSKTHVKFYSHTAVEDIEANNYATVSTINKETGEVVFSVPMQGFEFEKSLMQKHFNSDKFLDTKSFPKSKLTGKIANIDEVDFSKDGEYTVLFEGELNIKGKSKPVSEKGTIIVKGDNVGVQSKFNLTLADFGITFVEGKPASNIAKEVEVTVKAEYMGE